MSDLKKVLDALHTGLAQELLDRIENGSATASDLSVARQFLKDNGIDSVPTKDKPLANLAQALPFSEADDAEDEAQLPN